MGVTRLAAATAAAAIAFTIAPPALAEPEPEPKPGQLVAVAGIGESGFAGDGGDARDARLGGELDIAVAQNGAVYIADRANEVVRVVGTDGVINSIRLADTENIGAEPVAVAVTPAGVLYVATSRGVRRLNPDGSLTVVAGGGSEYFDLGGDGGDGGPATEAGLYLMDLAVAGDGTLYLSDWGAKRIRRVTPDGTITTVTTAVMDQPGAVAAGPQGTVYFTDLGGRGVQKADANGTVTAVLEQPAEDGFAGDGGPAGKAKYGVVTGIATDEAGNLFVADSSNGNIRVIDTSGVINTVGPSVQTLGDVAVGPDGDLYLVGDAQVTRLVRGGAEPAIGTLKLGPARWRDQDPGTILPVVGAGRQMTDAEELDSTAHSIAVDEDGTVYYTVPTDDKIVAVGTDRAAIKVNSPGAITTDQAGNVYVVEELDYRIRKIDATGTATTFAGTGARADADAPNGDGGPATEAPIDPASLATGRDGSVYIGETNVGGGRIRKINPRGIITTIAGGGEQKPGKSTRANELYFGRVDGLAVDANDVVYLSSYGQVYAVTPDGAVAPVAGTGGQGFSGDGGPATQAQVNLPSGLAVGKDGTRYLADTDNNRIRAIGADGTITTVATLTEPEGVAADQAGNLYVTTDGGSRIRKIDRTGTITTVERIGLVVDPDATKTVLGSPSALCVDAAGTVYAGGTKLVLAATAAGKARKLADLSYVEAMAAGPDGSVYVVNRDRVERFYPDGAQVTVAGGGASLGDPLPDVDGKRATSVMLEPKDVAVGPAGELYLTSGSRVYRLNRDGTLKSIVDMKDRAEPGSSGEYHLALAVRHDGVLYVAEPGSHRVFAVRDGKVSTFAGTGEPGRIDERGDGDRATEAPVAYPGDLAVDRDGTLYIAASEGVRRVNREGDIDTVVEKLPTRDGRASTAPDAIALDQHGNLYFTASDLHQVQVMVRPGELPGPFSWAVIWIGLLVVAVVGSVMFAVVRRTVTKTQPAS